MQKKPRGYYIIRRLLQAFESIHKKKMEQILLAYGLIKETIAAAIMMLYKNMKVYCNIVADALLGDTLASYLFIICRDDVLRMSIDKMKDNGFKL